MGRVRGGVHQAKSREGIGERKKAGGKEGRQSIIREDGKEERSRARGAQKTGSENQRGPRTS